MSNYRTSSTASYSTGGSGIFGLGACAAVIYSIAAAMGPIASFFASILGVSLGGWGAFGLLLLTSAIGAATVAILLWTILSVVTEPRSGNVTTAGGGDSGGGYWGAYCLLWAMIFLGVCALAAWSNSQVLPAIALGIPAIICLIAGVYSYRSCFRNSRALSS